MRNKISHGVFVAASLILPLLLFSFIAYNNYGYDDEISSIRHVESYSSLHSLIKAHFSWNFVDIHFFDIHPLGQYVINYVLLKILGSWPLVRVAGALVVSLSLWFFWSYMVAKKWKDSFALALSYILICLNPSVMLWSGLRWYTYFLPLLCLMGILFEPPAFLDSRKYLFWGLYFLTASVMFFIETSAGLMISVSFILLLCQRRARLKQEIGALIIFGLLSLAVVSPQIYIFLTVLYPNAKNSGEFYSFMSSFVGGGQNFLSGHAVIPVSFPGVILITANLVMFVVLAMNIRDTLSSWRNKFFVLSYSAIIAAKIGGKIRNFISTSALLGAFVTDTFTHIKNRKLKIFLLCLYIIGTICGIHNVMFHSNTTKGSWNTPYGEVIAFLESYDPEKKCPVVSHDPVFNYHAGLHGFDVIIAERNYNWLGRLKNMEGTVIILQTFKGSMPNDDYKKFNQYIDSRKIILEKRFGYDKYAGFKRIFNKECPDYYAVILVTE